MAKISRRKHSRPVISKNIAAAYKESWLIKLFVFSITISCVSVAAVFILRKHLPPEVPLFYGQPQDERQLTHTLGLVIPSLSAILINVVNLLISLSLKNDFLKKALIISGFAISLLSIITTVQIIVLVGSF